MPITRLALTAFAAAALAGPAPARAAVAVYTSEAAFDAAIAGVTRYTPVQDAFFASTYAFGPVTETATFMDTYTGDYGPGVRSLGAFVSPVEFSSTQTALGLALGYYVGPQTATYTLDGVSGEVTVPDNADTPDTVFIGFTDDRPIAVSFATDGAEFDTLRVVSGGAVSAAPEPSTWALLMAGLGAIGLGLRRAKRAVSLRAGGDLAA